MIGLNLLNRDLISPILLLLLLKTFIPQNILLQWSQNKTRQRSYLILFYGTGGIRKLNCFLVIPLTKTIYYCQNNLVRE